MNVNEDGNFKIVIWKGSMWKWEKNDIITGVNQVMMMITEPSEGNRHGGVE